MQLITEGTLAEAAQRMANNSGKTFYIISAFKVLYITQTPGGYKVIRTIEPKQ